MAFCKVVVMLVFCNCLEIKRAIPEDGSFLLKSEESESGEADYFRAVLETDQVLTSRKGLQIKRLAYSTESPAHHSLSAEVAHREATFNSAFVSQNNIT